MNIVPKIEVQTNKKQLEEIVFIMSGISRDIPQARHSKAFFSALYSIYIKLSRKLLTKSTSNKNFKISFEVYEADYLEKFLRMTLEIDENRHVQLFADILHQKLA